MTDIFISYSSKDIERVRPIRRQFADRGFEIFWDQTMPPGIDWDMWIRQHLTKARCVIVLWSSESVKSPNVRHEATVARHEGKFIAALLDPLSPTQFPMGFYSEQAANLSAWTGDTADDQWIKLQHEVETKLMPPWIRQLMDGYEARLVAERARTEVAERRDRTFQEQISQEIRKQAEFKRERDDARAETDQLKERVAELEAERRTLRADPSASHSDKIAPPGPVIRNPRFFLVQAITLLTGGVLAVATLLADPLGHALLAVVFLAGWVRILNSFNAQRDFRWALLIPALACCLAAFTALLGISHEYLLGLILSIEGLAFIGLALQLRARPLPYWQGLLTIGLIAVACATLILARYPLLIGLALGLIYVLAGIVFMAIQGHTTRQPV